MNYSCMMHTRRVQHFIDFLFPRARTFSSRRWSSCILIRPQQSTSSSCHCRRTVTRCRTEMDQHNSIYSNCVQFWMNLWPIHVCAVLSSLSTIWIIEWASDSFDLILRPFFILFRSFFFLCSFQQFCSNYSILKWNGREREGEWADDCRKRKEKWCAIFNSTNCFPLGFPFCFLPEREVYCVFPLFRGIFVFEFWSKYTSLAIQMLSILKTERPVMD